MHAQLPRTLPTLRFWDPRDPDDSLSSLMLRLDRQPCKKLVRITGTCDLSEAEAELMMELFDYGFRGFDGGLLIGGSRMALKRDLTQYKPAVTEVGPMIRRQNKACFVLGVVPRCRKEFGMHPDEPLFVLRALDPIDNSSFHPDYARVVHPHLSYVIAATSTLGGKRLWDDEVLFCDRVIDLMTHDIDIDSFDIVTEPWTSLHIAYGGGKTTERELQSAARNGRPVLVIEGSGGICDRLAGDPDFSTRPNVVICPNDRSAFRGELEKLAVVPELSQFMSSQRLRAV